jgi:hypothetical protein
MATAIGSDIAESSLVLAIDFANPKSYPGSGTTVFDLSGNNYNGTLTNGPTFSTEYGGACVLDGSNDYIQFNNILLSGTGDFCISIWFRWTLGIYGTIFGNYLAGNLQMFFGTQIIGMWLNNSTLYSDGTANFTPNPVNMVVRRSGTTTTLIIDNSLRMTASSSADIGSTSNFRIGANTIGTEVFGGYIYSFYVYNRFLSTAEIAQNYNSEIRRFLPTQPVIDSSLVLNLDAGNRLSFLNYGGSKSYWSGGSYNNTNVTDKLTYSNDTTAAQTSANLSVAKGYPGGGSDGATKGYICGDISPSAATDKLVFSNDTCAAQTSANLSSSRGGTAGASDYSTKMFLIGGYPTIATADRIYFSTDTASAVTNANYTSGKTASTSGLTDLSTKAYFCGGSTGTDVVILTTDKIIYSTEITMTATTANLSVAKRNPAGFSGVTGRGYFCGGYAGAATNNFDKVSFADDTRSAISTTLSQSRWGPNGGTEASSKAFICGGYVSGGVATADKFLLAVETCAAQSSANLSVGRYLPTCLEEIYNTSSTTWVDLNPFNTQNNGTLTNGPTYSLATNGSIVFDGTNDYVAATAPTFFNNYTISCFFNITSLNALAAGLVVWGNETTSQRRGIIYWNGGSGTNYKIYSSTFGSNVAGTTNLAISTWYHATVTVDGSGNAAVYLNGLQQNTGTNTLATPSSNTLKIGTSTSAGEYLNGQIALVQIYNRVLSASEVLQNFNAYRQRFGV